MSSSLVSNTLPTVAPEVHEFANAKEVDQYMNDVISLAAQAFPASGITVSLGNDVEDESHQYIAIDVDVAEKTGEELLAGQRIWSSGINRVCPPRYAVYFVLGWQ